jgi:squalene-hopene/tetraprenyl-beta-curcumene cyclase
MSSGRIGPRRLRFDLPHAAGEQLAPFSRAAASTAVFTPDLRLADAIERTRDLLLSRQHAEGYWVGELEGDTILESEYILLLAFLGRENSDVARRAANYMLEQQLPGGGWAIYPGGPLEISASVKAYFALKLTGHSPNAEDMQRARAAILDAGGAERVNSFTRYYLALLGIISYHQCPAVPPELMLIPHWCPFNIYEMSAWSRTIIVPLSLLWAYRPVRRLPPEFGIDELFHTSPAQLPVSMAPAEAPTDFHRKPWINWGEFFRRADRCFKLLERARIRPLRQLAIAKAAKWMTERFEQSDGLGAIFPPIIWSVVALKCLGHADDSPLVQAALNELEKLSIHENDTTRLEPCKSPVWDTAIALIALRDAGVEWDAPEIRRAVDWLLAKEVRRQGDWSVSNPAGAPAGWYFEFNNEFYPDVDDTIMVVMALCRCLPSGRDHAWNADFLLDEWSPHEADRDAAAIVSARRQTAERAIADLDASSAQLKAIWRGARWVLAMQSRDGGWGAFDANNDRELFTLVPFADHNAMIDPSTADITARVLEMFAHLKVPPRHPALQKAIRFVWGHQENDHCWYGRWGVNYIYGTWQVLVGLRAMGISAQDARIRLACNWLKQTQQPSGGWGETPQSYDDPALRGQGPATASQTAWALMGLMAGGEANSEAVRRGIQYLLDTQREDGTWDEPWFTGTGFPRVFYLKYHLYSVYFPLMALARYARQGEAAR